MPYNTKQYNVDPEGLLALARQAEVKRPPRPGIKQYVKAAEVLKRRGFTWVEIGEWFKEHGIDVASNTICSAVREWGKTQEYIDWCAEEDKEAELSKFSS